MFSASTAYSLVAQLARLVRSPSARLDHRVPAARPATDACGLCPHCGEFVVLAFDGPDEGGACPRCGRAVDELEPLGGS